MGFVRPAGTRAGRMALQHTARALVPVPQRDRNMAKRCEVCHKGPVVGRTVSHAHNVGPRRFEPNLQRVRAIVNGATKRIRVCTRCLRNGKVTKAA